MHGSNNFELGFSLWSLKLTFLVHEIVFVILKILELWLFKYLSKVLKHIILVGRYLHLQLLGRVQWSIRFKVFFYMFYIQKFWISCTHQSVQETSWFHWFKEAWISLVDIIIFLPWILCTNGLQSRCHFLDLFLSRLRLIYGSNTSTMPHISWTKIIIVKLSSCIGMHFQIWPRTTCKHINFSFVIISLSHIKLRLRQFWRSWGINRDTIGSQIVSNQDVIWILYIF